jgi:hypothetical protein
VCGNSRGEYVRACPHRVIRGGGVAVGFAVQSWTWLRREDGGGLLPEPGTWQDQPAAWVEAIETLDSEVGRIRQENLKKDRPS